MIQKKCFFSVLNKDFITGFKVFATSLLKHNPWLKKTQNDIVLVSVDLTDEEKKDCEKIYKHIKWIEPQSFPETFKESKTKIGKCALYKLQAFSLYEYDLVISIDVGDMVIVKPIPEIFSFNTSVGMVQGWTRDHGWHDKNKAGGTFNGGLVILNREHRNPYVYEKLINKPTSPYFDQQIINDEFRGRIAKLPVSLNFSKRLIECADVKTEDAKIIHYVGEKPWQEYEDKKYFQQIEKNWHDIKETIL